MYDAAGEEEQQDEGAQHDDQTGQWQRGADGVLGVDEHGGVAADKGLSRRWFAGPYAVEQPLCVTGCSVESTGNGDALQSRCSKGSWVGVGCGAVACSKAAGRAVSALHSGHFAQLACVRGKSGGGQGRSYHDIDDAGLRGEVVAQGVADLVASRAGGQGAV